MRLEAPSGVRGEAPAATSFDAFCVLQVSSPAVLLLDLGVIHSEIALYPLRGTYRKSGGYVVPHTHPGGAAPAGYVFLTVLLLPNKICRYCVIVASFHIAVDT